MASGPITSWRVDGKNIERVTDFIFLGSKITVDINCGHEIKRHLPLGRRAMTNLDSGTKKQTHDFANKGLFKHSYGFPSSHVWIWELDHTEGWATKNWCFRTVVLEKNLESPLNNKEIKPVNPKRNQPWISLEGLMLKLKLQYFGHLMQRAESLEKTLNLGKLESRRRRGW